MLSEVLVDAAHDPPGFGRGRVFSFVVYRRTYHPGMPAPYVVALVELDEGPRLISNIVGCEPEEVAIDMPVEVRFEEAGDFKLAALSKRPDIGGGNS